MGQVTVAKSMKTGLVVNTSSNNPNEAWIMLKGQDDDYYQGGRLWKGRSSVGFLRSTIDKIVALNLKENQVLEGHICVQDTLVPIMAKNPDFGKRVPQSKVGVAYTPELGTTIRNACTKAGLFYCGVTDSGEVLPIYRKSFYSPYPEGHPKYEATKLIVPVNLEAVNAFINAIPVPVTADPAAAKAAATKAAKAKAKAEALAALAAAEIED